MSNSQPPAATASNTPRRRAFIAITTVVSFFCIFVPWVVHTPEPLGSGGFILDFSIFHTSWYKNFADCLRVCDDHMTFAGGEIWEFWAIMNSFLTTFTLQITSKGRGEVWAAIASGVISFLALGALGFHHVIIFGLQHQVAYGILLVLALLGYTVSDILLWVHGGMEESEFLAIFYFVDMPVLVGFVIFFAYVVSELRLPENVRLINDDFIGGAIAFQLILGNIVLSFIRGRITDYTVPFVRLKAWLKSSGDSMRS